MNAFLRLPERLRSDELLDLYHDAVPFFFAAPDHSLLAQGCYRQIDHSDIPVGERVARALRQARADGHPSPAMVGAIPFDTTRPAALSIPHTLLRADPVATRFAQPRANPCRVAQCPSPQTYADGVAHAISRIQDRHLDKVVLARTLDLTSQEPVDMPGLLARLAVRNPHGYTFAVRLGDDRTLIGASPELLVSRKGGSIRANPLAGSIPRSPDPKVDRERAAALMTSAKDLEEHRVVVEAVRDSLAPMCRQLQVPARPSLVHTATMWHLSTEILGETDETSLDLALALHPTPAVCGFPARDARALIDQIEPFDRGFYTGMLGWTNASGDGEWIVTIRCAEVASNRLRLFAGAGVVADSRPESEVAETAAKFRTMLDAMGVSHEDAWA